MIFHDFPITSICRGLFQPAIFEAEAPMYPYILICVSARRSFHRFRSPKRFCRGFVHWFASRSCTLGPIWDILEVITSSQPSDFDHPRECHHRGVWGYRHLRILNGMGLSDKPRRPVVRSLGWSSIGGVYGICTSIPQPLEKGARCLALNPQQKA